MPKPPENFRTAVTPPKPPKDRMWPTPIFEGAKERKLWIDLAQKEGFDRGFAVGLIAGFFICAILTALLYVLAWG